jgi:NarL family two-component system response regulator LiaR
MTTIALVDDHPLAIKGIGAWLIATGRFSISGTAKTLAEAESLMEHLDPLPDIIILDISLGAEDGLAFFPILKEICRNRKATLPGVLVCSMHEDPFLIQRAMDSGARAYVAKSAESEEIVTAIDAILAGKSHVDPRYSIHTQNHAWTTLTPRENEIVSLIKRSMSNKQIAKQLGLSIRTVENHLAHIYVKTDTANRAGLMEL